MKKYFLFFLIFISSSSISFAQLDAKNIASTYYKGVVKILLFDSVAEKNERGKGYISRGSGFIVSDDGIIFTNRHVIEFCVYGYAEYDYNDKNSGSKIRVFETYTEDLSVDPDVIQVHRTGFATPIVQVYTGKGEKDYKLYRAEVLTVGMGSFDGAMIKIVSDMEGNPVNTKFFSLPIGNSDKTQQGEDLCIFGFPAQYDGGIDLMIKDMSTLTFGKLSGYDYVFNKDYGYIKTDASINSGNSGGPVFNETNKVIGIATATGNKTNIGLVAGINGMYHIVSVKGSVLKDFIAKGLTPPENAGSLLTVSGEKVEILSAEDINKSKSRSKNSSVENQSNSRNSKISNNEADNSSPLNSYYYARSKISFTEFVNSDGSLGNKIVKFTIDSTNKGLVFVDVDNFPKKLHTEKLIVDIHIKEGKEYKRIETKIFNISPEVKASYFKYTFQQPGDYKFAIYNQEEIWINNGFISVVGKSAATPKVGRNIYTVNSNYYNNSKVSFTNNINANGSLGPLLKEFTIHQKNNGLIYVDVDNFPKQLKTERLIVDVYKKEGNDYKKVDTKTFNITPTVKASYFKYVFSSEGEYKFAIYNQDEVWINNGFIVVKK